MNKAAEDVRRACNVLATYHRDHGSQLSEFSGNANPFVIFVTADEEIQNQIREFAKGRGFHRLTMPRPNGA
jgi:hypothetical protein